MICLINQINAVIDGRAMLYTQTCLQQREELRSCLVSDITHLKICRVLRRVIFVHFWQVEV